MFWIVLSFLRQRNSTFLVDQCLLVASSLLHQRKLIYPKSSALHDLRYVITLTREHWLWLGYITGSSKIKDKWLSLWGSMHRQVESWTCTLNFRFIVFVKHVSMQAVIISTGIFSLQNIRKCMVFSNKFVSFIHRSHLYLTRKTLIVPDDVYP